MILTYSTRTHPLSSQTTLSQIQVNSTLLSSWYVRPLSLSHGLANSGGAALSMPQILLPNTKLVGEDNNRESLNHFLDLYTGIITNVRNYRQLYYIIIIQQ